MRTFFSLAQICLFAFCITSVEAAEDYSTWTYSSDVTLNTSASGANVANDVSGCPILIRLTSFNFIFAEARNKGQDIRFASTGGAPLSYEIELWDSTAATAEIWVQPGTILGNKAGQIIRMYWGNANAADSSNSKAVFNTTDGFAGVWHLNKSFQDGTPNGNNGTDSNTVDVAGIIGRARSFSKTASQYIQVNYSASLNINSFTFSAWTKVFDTSKNQGIISTRFGSEYTFDAQWDIGHFGLHGDIGTGTAWLTTNADYKTTPVVDAWNYVTWTVTTNAFSVYLNGIKVADSTYTGTPIFMQSGQFARFGQTAGTGYYNGVIDEPRVDNVVRSPDWIKLSYENQKASQTLVTLKLPIRCQAVFAGPKDTSGNEGESVTLTATADCATSVAWTVVSGPAPKILDPEAKNFSVTLPRVTGDTVIVYRFTAVYADSSPHKDVRVSIKDNVPDPAFTLPADPSWNGRDSLVYLPNITNLAAIKASKDSILHWAWTLTGPEADTAWLKEGLLLKTAATGKLQVKLCLDNGGAPVCKTADITVTGAPSSAQKPASIAPLLSQDALNGFDATGRKPVGAVRSHIPRFQRVKPAQH